ncbi:MAG: redox-sensing transcriptional repressor Rex [Armatimonadota bacterium]
MAKENQVPLPALERLSTYIRSLIQLEHDGIEFVSSQDMQAHTGVSAAQFRKDLSYFGEFGKRGIGYNVKELHARIAQLLNIDEEQNVLLVGAGHLGSALIAYPGWRAYRFKIAAVFDRDPERIGSTIRRLTIHDIAELEAVNRTVGARIAILAIPAWEAQGIAERLVASGIRGIINFAPIKLQVPEKVVVREVCFICELAISSHLIHHQPEPNGSQQPAADAEPGTGA